MTDLNFSQEFILGPSALTKDELRNRQHEWLITLSKDEFSELEMAASNYLSLGLNIGV